MVLILAQFHEQGLAVQQPCVSFNVVSICSSEVERILYRNPADAAIGPQLYDAHLYFSFGTFNLEVLSRSLTP